MTRGSKERGNPVIREIEISNFRAFSALKLEDCARINLIVGDNGSGKTALCEAMFLALCSDPASAMKPRAWRGLPEVFQGSADSISQAVWGAYFHDNDLTKPVVIQLTGGGPEARRLVISQSSEISGTVPLDILQAFASGGEAMLFEWTNNAGKIYHVQARFTAQGLERRGEIETLPPFHFYSAFSPVAAQQVADEYSKLSVRNKHRGFVAAIIEQYPWIREISVETSAGSPVLYASVEGSQVKLPLADVSGAINRFAAIFLAMASRPGSLAIVDEIENGLHHSHQKTMWDALLAFARQMDSQLFLTTHNEEWLEAVVASPPDELRDVAFWRLQRGSEGKPEIKRFSAETVQAALETGNEVR